MSRDLVFYDGGCGLCHRTVLFLLRRDPEGSRFRFAPLGGGTFLDRVDGPHRAGLPDSVVVLPEAGGLLVKGAALLHLLRRLGGGWRLLGRLLALLPPGLLDWGYDRVAAVRRRLFRPPEGACPRLPPHLRDRFLP